jgi:hypothetical protein
MLNKVPVHRIILSALGIIVITLGILLISSPPAVFPDPSWGFQVMRSMQMGGPFNHLVSPSHHDIAKNTSEYLTWWSPGQYLVPYVFIKLLDTNIGQASAVVVLLYQLIGLAGFYIFFKKAGFTPFLSALSLVFIVCQQAFFSPFIFYNGGETLLFAFLGWFLYGCIVFDKPGFKLVLFVLLSGWLGFICKSSFLWMYAAGLFFIWINLSQNNLTIKNWLIKGFWIGIPSVTTIAIIYILYLSKGGNPSSGSNGFGVNLESVAFPLASPILSGFSVDDLANGLLTHNDTPVFSEPAALAIVALLAVLSLWLIYLIWNNVPNRNYKLILVIFYAVSILFFGSAYIRKMDISYEARHFRIIGLLIVPGTLFLFSRFKVVYRAALGAVVLFIAFFSIRFYILSSIALRTESARGNTGIAQQFIDQPALDYIMQLDKTNRNGLFVFFSADLGLEIQHNRIITMEALTPDININFDESVYKGHAGPLYILMPSEYVGIRANFILKCFPGYKGFSLKELSDDYVLYFAKDAR